MGTLYEWLTDTLAGLCVIMLFGSFLVGLAAFG